MKKRSVFLMLIISLTLLSTNGLALDLNNSCYTNGNPYYNSGYGGQCTAFAWGRACEHNSVNLQFNTQTYPSAKYWYIYGPISSLNLTLSSTIKSNSIAVWAGDGTNQYGHVAYVERVENGIVYFNEANIDTYNGSNWGGGYDGHEKSYTVSQFEHRETGVGDILGYIYLVNTTGVNINVYEFWRRADPIIASNQNGQNNFDAQYKIKNNSNSPVTIDDMAIAILKDGTYLFDCWKKNSSTSISSNDTYHTGIHYCEIYDSGSYTTEARLNINGQWQTYDSQSFTVHEQENVTVYDFWRQSDPIYASNQNGENNFEAQFKIKNNNSSSTTIDDIAIHVLKDGTNLFDCWRKNSSTTISGNSSYETGRHFCEIYNSGSYSTEARLMINGQWSTYECLSFTVLDQQSTFPDLIVQSPSVSDTTLTPGQSFTVYATVKNQGSGSSSSTTLRYYRSTNSIISTGDTQISTDGVSALSAGGTSSESDSVLAPSTPGTYWIGTCVDTVSGESNTGNNCSAGVQITVANQTYPDLIVQSPSVSDTTLTPGQSFTVYATVKNQGSGSSSSTTLRYYRSANSTISTGDTEIGTDSVSSLSPGGTSPEDKGNRIAPSTPGTYWIGACVDSVSGEPNTGNNCSAGVQITVIPPPYIPSNPNPPTGAIDVSIDPHLDFSGGVPYQELGATVTYDVYMESNQNPNNLVCNDVSASQCNPSGNLSYNTTYYWKVIALDEQGATTSGPIWSFTTETESNNNLSIVPILKLLLMKE